MIAICLIRIAIFEGSRHGSIGVAQISFARALTETRLFLKLLMSSSDPDLWPSMWEVFVQCCMRRLVKYKPGRQFTRDKQEYRKKSRGLEKRNAGRRRKYKKGSLPPRPETHKGAIGQVFLLS